MDELAEHRDDMHRALGRYIAEFSRLVYWMRSAMELHLQRPGDPPELAQIALDQLGAGQIAAAYFGFCKVLGQLEGEDDTMRRMLQEEVLKTTNERNDMAHGDWWIGWTSLGAGREITHTRTRARPKHGRGTEHEEFSPADIDKLSEHVQDLRFRIGEFGSICFRNHPTLGPTARVKDVFVIRGTGDKRRVVAEGPKAS